MKIAPAAIALGLLTLASTAFAGQTLNSTVYISSTSYYAMGSLTAARYSSDTLEYIGCEAWSWTSSGTTHSEGECYANDYTGNNYVSCYTTNPAFISLISGVNASSGLYFTWSSGSNTCTEVSVANRSDELH
jgi:hypothetical protein